MWSLKPTKYDICNKTGIINSFDSCKISYSDIYQIFILIVKRITNCRQIVNKFLLTY